MSPDESPGARLSKPGTLAALAAEYGGTLDDGAGARTARRIVAPGQVTFDDDLVLVTRASAAERALEAPGVLLCTPDVAGRIVPGRRWIHAHASWVAARLLTDRAGPGGGIARTAVVDAEAEIDPSAEIRDGAVVQRDVRVGPGSVVSEGAVICERTRIGARVLVGPNAVVGRPGFGWAEGPNGERVRIPQLGGVVVEDDVEIGPLATVDAGTLGPTVIRRGAKLDAHVHVGHNVTIGEGTLVAAQAGFAGSSRIGAGVLVGGQVGVTDHVVVGDRARLAAKSGVIGDVAAGATVAGYPAIPRVQWLRAWASLLGRSRPGEPGGGRRKKR